MIVREWSSAHLARVLVTNVGRTFEFEYFCRYCIDFKITLWSIAAFYANVMISYTEICHCSRSKPLLPQTLALKKKTGPCCLISRPWLLASRCCRICLGADGWRGGRWVLQVSPSVHWGLDLCSQHLCWLLQKKKKKKTNCSGWSWYRMCLCETPGLSVFWTLNGRVYRTCLYPWNRCYKGWY